MKNLILFLLGLFGSGTLLSAGQLEPPAIEWQVGFGGTDQDYLKCVLQTSDGGFIVGGDSWSGTNGNKTSPTFGGFDWWIIRLDAVGHKIWERSFGGSADELLGCIAVTSDGGFVLAGSSRSPVNGNKTSPNLGGFDAWLIQIDADGNKVWEKTYGGTGDDLLVGVIQTPDGGFILGGNSRSDTNATKTSPHFGQSDYWLVGTDALGNQLWDKSYGGTGQDSVISLRQVPAGGFILGGESRSSFSGNKATTNYSALHDSSDYWIVRADNAGEKLWEANWGGSRSDLGAVAEPTADSGFIVGGYSSSLADGNKTTPAYGISEYWLVRMDSAGNKLSELVFGGGAEDVLGDLRQTSDEGFIVTGSSTSGVGGNKTVPGYGGADEWVIRCGASGAVLWELTLGGTGAEGVQITWDGIVRTRPGVVTRTADGGFIVGVTSTSPPDGNKTTPNYGQEDFWIVKLGPERYRVNLEVNAPGLGTTETTPASGSDGRYAANASVTLTANPSPGYAFAFWSGDLAGTNNPFEIMVTSNTTARANFVGLSPPVLSRSPSALSSLVAPGQASSSASFAVWNSGGGILGYLITTDVLWLAVTPATGQSLIETNFHLAMIDASFLAYNSNYVGTINIMPLDLAGESQAIGVTMSRTGTAPRLAVDRQSFASLQQNGFRLTLLGQSNSSYRTEVSSNLLDWAAFQTNVLTTASSVQIIDRSATNWSQRFYRTRLWP